MLTIPIQPIPSQSVKTVLAGQNCEISIYQKTQGVFVDVTVDGTTMSIGVIARDATALVSRDYAGFLGNLMFVDTQGASDPDYTGLGARYTLVYLTAAEYALV